MLIFRRSIKDLVKGREYQKLVQQHRVGNHVVSQLTTLLDDKDSWVCARAAWALGEISLSDAGATKGAVPKLIRLLDNGRAHIRANAAGALWAVGKSDAEAVKGAVPRLVRLLDDEDADIRYNAAWTLGAIEAEEALEPLHHLLQDNSEATRGKTVAEVARETIKRIEQKIRMRKAIEMLAALKAKIDSL